MGHVEKEDRLLKNLMKHAKQDFPFLDFEERMMDKIRQEKSQQESVSGSIRISWLFFFVGLFLGLLITDMVSNLDELIKGVPAEKIAFYLQIGIALVLLFQFEKLIGLTFKKKS
jgi:hypothetical protein